MKYWLSRYLAPFGVLFIFSIVSFGQTKWWEISEIRSAALWSDKNYQESWHGTPPPEVEYGEYEIPSQYWTDAIKELRPVKMYDHHLNVAVVLSIKDGVEEGIYIHNVISSYGLFPGVVDENGFESKEPAEGSLINFRRMRVPRFEDYLVAAVFTGTPASPKSVPASKEDLEKIRNGIEKGWGVFYENEERKGANFAGHFILIKWNCGSSCLGMTVVDAKTGDIFPPPDTTNCCDVNFKLLHSLTYPGQTPQPPEVQFRVNSNLLTIKSNSLPSNLPYTYYYIWQGNRWTLLRRVPQQRTESDSQKR
jgi:hypothetical protein